MLKSPQTTSGSEGVCSAAILRPSRSSHPEFVVVLIVADLATIRYVHGSDTETAACGPQQSRFRILVLTVTEPDRDVVDADATQDCHAVPPTDAEVHAVVPERLEGHQWERRIGALRLLHAQHVRPHVVSHSSMRGNRAFSEFTFHVANRMTRQAIGHAYPVVLLSR